MTVQQKPAATQLIFAALADATRRRMLTLLSDKSSSASRLSEPLGISRQATARHLGILLDAGLARRRRDGREIVFELALNGLGPAADFIGTLRAAADGKSSR